MLAFCSTQASDRPNRKFYSRTRLMELRPALMATAHYREAFPVFSPSIYRDILAEGYKTISRHAAAAAATAVAVTPRARVTGAPTGDGVW